jgi:hypothetical protein
MKNFDLPKTENLSREEKVLAVERKKDTFYELGKEKRATGLRKMVAMKRELSQRGINAGDFLFWHMIIGSTPDKHNADLDTPNGDIEKFIDSLIS